MTRDGGKIEVAPETQPASSASNRARSGGLSLGNVLATAAVVVLAIGIPVYLVLWSGFDDLENREIVRDLERGRASLQSAATRLADLAEDWAYWNDTYAAQGGYDLAQRTRSLSRNLTKSHFSSAPFNLLYLTNAEGKTVWGRVFDPDSGGFVQLEGLPTTGIGFDHPLIARGKPGQIVSGLLLTERGLMAVASSPVRLAGRVGPPSGRLIMGRFLNDMELSKLQQNAAADLEAVVLHNASATADTAPSESGGEGAELVVMDLFGKPAVRLHARSVGAVLEFAESTLRYAGLVFMLAIWIALAGVLLFTQRYGIVRRGSLFQQVLGELESNPDRASRASVADSRDADEAGQTYSDSWIDDEAHESSADDDAPLEASFSTSDLMEVVESIHHPEPERKERRKVPSAQAIDPSALDAAVYRDGVQMIYRNAEVSVTFSAIGVIGLAAMLIGEVPDSKLAIWFGLSILVLGVRIAQIFARRRAAGFPRKPKRLAMEFALGAGAIGLIMGVGFVWMSADMTVVQQAVYTVTIVGYAAGGATSLSPHRASFLALVLPMFVPLCGMSFFNAYVQVENEQALLGVFAMAFGAILLIVNSYNNEAIGSSLKLRYEKDHLLAQLEESNQSLSEDRQLFLQASLTDALTRLPNRRHFDQLLTREWRRCLRAGVPMSCVLLDIDHFKAFNDHYGHQAGDKCLSQVGGCLRRLVKRSNDLPARYGGEEFAVVLPETPLAGATAVADELRARVEALGIPHALSTVSNHVTISVGVACMVPSKSSSPGELVRFADEALYVAKNDGRNRTHVRALMTAPAVNAAQA